MTIRNKKDNLFNYFASDHKNLSKQYIKGCETFFKSINKKRELATNCRSCGDYIYKNRNPIDWRYCDECPANNKKDV